MLVPWQQILTCIWLSLFGHLDLVFQNNMTSGGHVIVDEPRQYGHQVDLDTGCYCRGWLTAGILDNTTGLLVTAVQVSQQGEIRSIAGRSTRASPSS